MNCVVSEWHIVVDNSCVYAAISALELSTLNWVGCRLNEEMIETLFVVNNSNQISKDAVPRSVHPLQNQEDRVLDPKKSQNIAILLKALNVTKEEVCEALLQGTFHSSMRF